MENEDPGALESRNGLDDQPIDAGDIVLFDGNDPAIVPPVPGNVANPAAIVPPLPGNVENPAAIVPLPGNVANSAAIVPPSLRKSKLSISSIRREKKLRNQLSYRTRVLEDVRKDNKTLQKHADRLEDHLAVDARLQVKMEGEFKLVTAATSRLSHLLNERTTRFTESTAKIKLKHKNDKTKMNVKLAAVRNDRDSKVAVMRMEFMSSIAVVKKQGENDLHEAAAEGERKCASITAKYDEALSVGQKKLDNVQKKNGLLREQGEKTLIRSRKSCRTHWDKEKVR